MRFFSLSRLQAVSLISLLAFCSPVPGNGQQLTATTDPVGFITLDIVGNNGTNGGLSFLGLGMRRPVEYQGSAETVGANTLTDNQATWTNNQFNGAGNAYYVEIASGSAAGTTYDITGTAAATKTITLAQNLASGVTGGVSFKIRRHWTIASVFGPNNESGLQGGDGSSADQILIFDGAVYNIFYYQTVGFGTGWRNAASPAADAGGTVIYPEEGLILKRQQPATVSTSLMGAVKTGQSSIPLFSGLNIVANLYAAPMTLASSDLYTGNPATGLAAGDGSTADQVLIYNGASYDIYYFQTVGFGTGWRNAASPVNDAGATQIPVGSSIVIKRNGVAFNWIAPQHPSSFNP